MGSSCSAKFCFCFCFFGRVSTLGIVRPGFCADSRTSSSVIHRFLSFSLTFNVSNCASRFCFSLCAFFALFQDSQRPFKNLFSASVGSFLFYYSLDLSSGFCGGLILSRSSIGRCARPVSLFFLALSSCVLLDFSKQIPISEKISIQTPLPRNHSVAVPKVTCALIFLFMRPRPRRLL